MIEPAWAQLRLRDRLAPGVRVLFVGINPGVRSAETGHHFAGFSNRFWKLLIESRLVPEPITYVDDGRLVEWGLGITNLIARPTPGINDLRPQEYVEGWTILERKIRRYRPAVVALVGVTVYRAILPLLRRPPAPVRAAPHDAARVGPRPQARGRPRRAPVRAAESERAERELHPRGDARGFQSARAVRSTIIPNSQFPTPKQSRSRLLG